MDIRYALYIITPHYALDPTTVTSERISWDVYEKHTMCKPFDVTMNLSSGVVVFDGDEIPEILDYVYLCVLQVLNLTFSYAPPNFLCEKPWNSAIMGALVREGKLLLEKRPKDKPFGGLWGMPGGKPEKGETFIDTLQREWDEELGISFDPKNLTPHVVVCCEYVDRFVMLPTYACHEWSGTPEPKASDQLDWFLPSDLKTLDLIEAAKYFGPRFEKICV